MPYLEAGRTLPSCPAVCIVLLGKVMAPTWGTSKASCTSSEARCTPRQSFTAQLQHQQPISLEQQDQASLLLFAILRSNPSDFPARQQAPRQKRSCFYTPPPCRVYTSQESSFFLDIYPPGICRGFLPCIHGLEAQRGCWLLAHSSAPSLLLQRSAEGRAVPPKGDQGQFPGARASRHSAIEDVC